MSRVNTGLFMATIIAVLVSCQANKNEAKDIATEKNMLSTEKLDSNQRQFISKATLQMQVKNCLATTNLIEAKVKEHKGFVVKSELKKDNSDVTETVLSADSIKQTNTCTTYADMVMRVPDTALAAVLQYTESLGERVQARVINNTDVSFDVKLNALNHKIGNGETVILPENNNEIKEIEKLTKNESIVADLKMKDDIKFSTVSIALQQPEELITSVIVNKSATWGKGDSSFSRIWYSLQKGFFVLSNLFIFVLQFWWLLPLFFISKWGYIFGKKYFTKALK